MPKRYRTTIHTVPQNSTLHDCNLFTRQCINTYLANWNIVHYKCNGYSGTYADLPNKLKCAELKYEAYEIDIDSDCVDDFKSRIDGITKEGYLMKGPEIGKLRIPRFSIYVFFYSNYFFSFCFRF